MRIFGYLEFYYRRSFGKLDLLNASRLLSRTRFSSSKTREILIAAGANVGRRCRIRTPIIIEEQIQLTLEDDVFVNFGLAIVGSGKVTIGESTLVGPQVTLITVNHPLDPGDRRKQRTPIPANVCIQSNVWLGANVTVCAGVTIGENTVIGAGSVVTRDIPANCFAAGIPCKPIRSLTR